MAKWSFDSAHSGIEFRVRHMMISTIKGQFQSYDIAIETESEDLSEAKIAVGIDVSSITTNNQQRDEHLRGVDFFNAEKYNKITFVSTNITKTSSNEFDITGDLTIRDVTLSRTFKAKLGGLAKDPWGNAKVGYKVTGAINRSDFGLVWNAALETGGVMVSEEVKFTAELQFIKD